MDASPFTQDTLRPVAPDELQITCGQRDLRQRPEGALCAVGPQTRGVEHVESPFAHSAQLSFVYHGCSRRLYSFRSGEIRTQIGLKLRAHDANNLLYVMWQIHPTEQIDVQVKRTLENDDPRQWSHENYHSLSCFPLERDGEPVASARDGAEHQLRGDLLETHAGTIRLLITIDEVLAQEVLLPEKLLQGIEGPAGFRTDNGHFTFRLLTGHEARAESAVLPRGESRRCR